MRRFGILTGGGDCPGLNAVLRAVGKPVMSSGAELVGFHDGFLGVMEGRYTVLSKENLSGILTTGGTILGTSNRDNPFAWAPPSEIAKGVKGTDQSDIVVHRMKELGLEGLIIIGGDGSLSIAHRLHSEKGVNCVGVPKTIDNDLSGTEVTFGFDTAVQVATEAIDRLHTTAMSHHRAMVVEVMGRYAGWIALYAGVAGGADIILLPEIPFDPQVVYERIAERSRHGSRFSMVVVAEGAKPLGGELSVARTVQGSFDAIRLGGIATKLANEIEDNTGVESRAVILGHLQRGGAPTNRDRLLGTEFGYTAGKLAIDGKWGYVPACIGARFVTITLKDAVGTLKTVPADHSLVAAARAVGTSFGDRV